MRHRRAGRLRDAGQTVPLFVILAAVVLIVLLGLTRLTGALSDRARARTAADAAALAGARDGEDIAARVAEDNHARLETYVVVGREVEVTVRVGDERATARVRTGW